MTTLTTQTIDRIKVAGYVACYSDLCGTDWYPCDARGEFVEHHIATLSPRECEALKAGGQLVEQDAPRWDGVTVYALKLIEVAA